MYVNESTPRAASRSKASVPDLQVCHDRGQAIAVSIHAAATFSTVPMPRAIVTPPTRLIHAERRTETFLPPRPLPRAGSLYLYARTLSPAAASLATKVLGLVPHSGQGASGARPWRECPPGAS